MRSALALAVMLSACSGSGGTTSGGTSSGGTTSGVCPPVLTPQGPLVITDSNYGSGTFTGEWVSTVRTTPAVSIQTSKPVKLSHCIVSGPGNLIQADGNSVDLTVESCTGTGVNPEAAGAPIGSFVSGNTFSQLTVEHCDIENVRFGVWVSGEVGTTRPTNITLRYNTAKNLTGQNSDAGGGFALGQVDHVASDLFAIQGIEAAPSVEIAWNSLVNLPGQSAVDGALEIHQSSGTPQSPLSVHDNFFNGAYEAVPTDDDGTGTPFNGGVVSIDGTAGETLAQASGFISIHDNQVVNAGNIGINVVDGHDIQVYANRLVSSGVIPGAWPDGGIVASQFSNGVTVWNQLVSPATIFFNDVAFGNVSGWVQASDAGTPTLGRADYYFPSCDAGCAMNTDLPDPIDDSVEANESALWLQKLADAGVVLGPVCP